MSRGTTLLERYLNFAHIFSADEIENRVLLNRKDKGHLELALEKEYAIFSPKVKKLLACVNNNCSTVSPRLGRNC